MWLFNFLFSNQSLLLSDVSVLYVQAKQYKTFTFMSSTVIQHGFLKLLCDSRASISATFIFPLVDKTVVIQILLRFFLKCSNSL